MPPPIKWLPHLVSLIRIKAKTMTATQLAFEFGESRNAIIGLCRREEIPLVAFRNQHPWTAEKEKRKAVALRKPVIMKNGTVKDVACKPLPKAKSVAYGKPIAWPPEHGRCGYILGDVSRKTVCCGGECVAGRPYCLPHMKACYEKAKFPVARIH